VVAPAAIERAASEPPDDTRAWARAQLLRWAEPNEVESVDWDHIRFRLRGLGGGTRSWRVNLPDPSLGTRRELEERFIEAGSLGELVRSLGADPDQGAGPTGWGGLGNAVSWVNQGRIY
jgi:hypothetical protein